MCMTQTYYEIGNGCTTDPRNAKKKKYKRNSQNTDICPFAVQLNEPKIVKWDIELYPQPKK